MTVLYHSGIRPDRLRGAVSFLVSPASTIRVRPLVKIPPPSASCSSSYPGPPKTTTKTRTRNKNSRRIKIKIRIRNKRISGGFLRYLPPEAARRRAAHRGGVGMTLSICDLHFALCNPTPRDGCPSDPIARAKFNCAAGAASPRDRHQSPGSLVATGVFAFNVIRLIKVSQRRSRSPRSIALGNTTGTHV